MHGLFLHRGKDVCIDAERDTDMAISQQLLHDFRVHLHAEEYACCTVTQIVQQYIL